VHVTSCRSFNLFRACTGLPLCSHTITTGKFCWILYLLDDRFRYPSVRETRLNEIVSNKGHYELCLYIKENDNDNRPIFLASWLILIEVIAMCLYIRLLLLCYEWNYRLKIIWVFIIWVCFFSYFILVYNISTILFYRYLTLRTVLSVELSIR
jgi:hypothetical protein